MPCCHRSNNLFFTFLSFSFLFFSVRKKEYLLFEFARGEFVSGDVSMRAKREASSPLLFIPFIFSQKKFAVQFMRKGFPDIVLT